MATVATIPLVPADGSLTINDGAALSYTVIYEDGDFQASGLKIGQLTEQVYKDRGVPYAVRDIETDEAIEFSFSCHAQNIAGAAAAPTIGDIVLRKGDWAAFTSTLPTANGDTKTVKLTWTGERTLPGGATADTTIVLKYCKLSADFAEGLPGKWSIKGRAYCISSDYLTVTG